MSEPEPTAPGGTHPEHRPRVLQVLGSSAGGVARHVAQVAAAARPRGFDVLVAGPSALAASVSGGGALPYEPVEISDRPGRGDVVVVRRLRALASGADVVHAHGLRAGALVVLALTGRRRRPGVVVTLHNLPVGGTAVAAVAAVLERLVARGGDVVLGVSGDLVARAAARGARLTERALVPSPARPAPSRSRSEVRAALGLDQQQLVLTVGRLAPQKGLDLLCDAAAALGRGPDGEGPGSAVVWLVAGEGPLERELSDRITAEHLPVRLLGRREDVPDLLAAADVVVSTARWEGQPLGVQEALAVGAAVVATDVGGTREVTGDAAVLVAPHAAQIAAAVRSLLHDEDRRRALGVAARAQAGRLPDLDATMDQLERVWRSAIGRGGPG
ncbi:MAG: hypothetical protein JWP95_1509 [Actinotalea sp.]|nr:hypothetical protein [Actinotalea sp.]